MLSKSMMVPNSLFIMNLRELLLKSRTEKETGIEGIESLLNGTSIADIIGNLSRQCKINKCSCFLQLKS